MVIPRSKTATTINQKASCARTKNVVREPNGDRLWRKIVLIVQTAIANAHAIEAIRMSRGRRDALLVSSRTICGGEATMETINQVRVRGRLRCLRSLFAISSRKIFAYCSTELAHE
jgi:hypothetical protein